METTGAQTLVETLARNGVTSIFGYPGASTLPIHDALSKSGIRHYLMRHEQAAAHAADGYARATGRIGVCLATSGPGATNLVTGIATAYMDSTPLLALTGQVRTKLLGSDAFQETDIIGITMPITKHSYLINDAAQIEATIEEAISIAESGRPGPVLVDLPFDVMADKDVPQMKASTKRKEPSTNGWRKKDNGDHLKRIAQFLNTAEKPVIIVGGGVKLAHACTELSDLIKRAKIPFVSTMMGIGSVASPNGLNLGFIGTHGNELANHTIHRSDFILAIGVRFSDRSTAVVEEFAPFATIAQIDIDPTSISKNIDTDLAVIDDIRKALTELSPLMQETNRDEWLTRIQKKKDTLFRKDSSAGCGPAGDLIRQVQEALHGDATAVTDVGLNQIWTLRNWQARQPRTLLTPGGLGTMGFSVPAAFGAAVGTPDRSVVVFSGDGGLLMNIQELASVFHHNVPLKIVVFNNGNLGMIRQIQDLFYGSRFSDSNLGSHIDLVAIARGFGIEAERVLAEKPEAGIEKMRKSTGPFLLEAVVDSNNYVFPIVPPGRSNVEMIHEKMG